MTMIPNKADEQGPGAMFYRQDASLAGIGYSVVDRVIDAGRAYYLTEQDVSVVLVVHDAPLGPGDIERSPVGFGWQGGKPFYPASVVKLFWLLGCHARLEEGHIQPHPELDRSMHDMIKWSSNTAANYVIDLVTGTTGDTLLEGDAYTAWAEARDWLNRYVRSLGWPEIDAAVNVCQKTMDDDRYGRERQFVGATGDNHNSLTANATARFYQAVLGGQAVSAYRSSLMAALMHRPLDPHWVEENPNSQVKGYFGAGLPVGSRLWSKAGWTGWTGDPKASYLRHDSGYIEAPGCPPFTLVVFTQGTGASVDEAILPAASERACALLGRA